MSLETAMRLARQHNERQVGQVELSAHAENLPKVAKQKRKKPFAATLASEKILTTEGWTCCRVEQTVPHCFIKRDAYNFADLLCCSPTKGIMLVQVTGGTSTSNFHARVAKIRSEPRHAIWLASGGRIQVHSWEKVAGQKERKLRVLEITKLAILCGDQPPTLTATWIANE